MILMIEEFFLLKGVVKSLFVDCFRKDIKVIEYNGNFEWIEEIKIFDFFEES